MKAINHVCVPLAHKKSAVSCPTLHIRSLSQVLYRVTIMMYSKNMIATVLLFISSVYAASIADVIAENNALIPLADSTDVAVVAITAQTDAAAAQVSPFRLLVPNKAFTTFDAIIMEASD